MEKHYIDEYALGELQDVLERAYSRKADVTIELGKGYNQINIYETKCLYNRIY